jgi:hypothetical protein
LKIESSDSAERQFDVLDLFLAILANDGQGNWNHLSLTGGNLVESGSKFDFELGSKFDFELGSKFDLEPVNK